MSRYTPQVTREAWPAPAFWPEVGARWHTRPTSRAFVRKPKPADRGAGRVGTADGLAGEAGQRPLRSTRGAPGVRTGRVRPAANDHHARPEGQRAVLHARRA